MSLALLFHYLLLNIFRMLVHPSSGACDLFVDFFHVLYYSGSMCVGVTVWFGWGNTTHERNPQISRKLLKMDVPTFETCWAVNSEIIKQVTSSWSIFIQLSRWCTAQILYSITLSRKWSRYEIMWKNIVESAGHKWQYGPWALRLDT